MSSPYHSPPSGMGAMPAASAKFVRRQAQQKPSAKQRWSESPAVVVSVAQQQQQQQGQPLMNRTLLSVLTTNKNHPAITEQNQKDSNRKVNAVEPGCSDGSASPHHNMKSNQTKLTSSLVQQRVRGGGFLNTCITVNQFNRPTLSRQPQPTVMTTTTGTRRKEESCAAQVLTIPVLQRIVSFASRRCGELVKFSTVNKLFRELVVEFSGHILTRFASARDDDPRHQSYMKTLQKTTGDFPAPWLVRAMITNFDASAPADEQQAVAFERNSSEKIVSFADIGVTRVFPLHRAVQYGHLDLVKMLIGELGYPVNALDNQGDSALIVASELKREDVVEYLVKHPHIVSNLKDARGGTALHAAARAGAGRAMLSMLVVGGGCEIDAENNSGATALFCAVVEDRTKTAQYLLEKGAKVTRDMMKKSVHSKQMHEMLKRFVSASFSAEGATGAATGAEGETAAAITIVIK